MLRVWQWPVYLVRWFVRPLKFISIFVSIRNVDEQSISANSVDIMVVIVMPFIKVENHRRKKDHISREIYFYINLEIKKHIDVSFFLICCLQSDRKKKFVGEKKKYIQLCFSYPYRILSTGFHTVGTYIDLTENSQITYQFRFWKTLSSWTNTAAYSTANSTKIYQSRGYLAIETTGYCRTIFYSSRSATSIGFLHSWGSCMFILAYLLHSEMISARLNYSCEFLKLILLSRLGIRRKSTISSIDSIRTFTIVTFDNYPS